MGPAGCQWASQAQPAPWGPVMEIICDFDRNYVDEVMRLRAVWNGFQKEWEELDRRQALRLLFRGVLLLKGREMGW